jgi:hypothetical protein
MLDRQEEAGRVDIEATSAGLTARAVDLSSSSSNACDLWESF